MLRIICAAALMLVSGSAFARPGSAITTVNLRAESNTTSEIVAKIPGGSRIEVGDCTQGWCAVTFQGRSGFAIATALDTSGRVVRRGPPRRPVYDPDDDYEPVSPGYGPYAVAPPPVVYGPRYYGPGFYGPGPYWGPYGYRRPWGWRRW